MRKFLLSGLPWLLETLEYSGKLKGFNMYRRALAQEVRNFQRLDYRKSRDYQELHLGVCLSSQGFPRAGRPN